MLIFLSLTNYVFNFREEVTKLRVELSIMEDLKNELQRLRKENEELKTTCSVQESVSHEVCNYNL